jgi:hypothetical protein
MNFSLFFRGQSKGKCREDMYFLEKVGMLLIHISLVDSVFLLELYSVEMPTRTVVSSKDMAANCVRRALRHRVMVSSARQAICGLLASGGAVAAQYLGKKMAKAWQSRAA